ncbi:MAG: aldehyde dehydrogenase family protein [Pseudomonadota bacterium]
MHRDYVLTINGQGRSTDDAVEIRNPADGSLVGLAPSGSSSDVDDAIAAAAEAYKTWRNSDNEARKQVCATIAQVLQDNMGELTELLTREQGKPLKGFGSEFEVGGAIAWAQYTAAQELPVEVLEEDAEKCIELHRVPLGVVASITPWNYPLMIAIWHIVPALRAGNTVVMKPSPYTPLTTLRMVELVNEKIPAGLLNIVSGGDGLGAQLSQDDRVKKVVFTGSTRTGKRIMAEAAASLKALTLELGGNDACIVLPGENIEPYAEGLFWGAMMNSGQTCGAIKRLYVHSDDYDRACEVLSSFAGQIPMGDGMNSENLLGPIQNEKQFNYVSELVSDAKANGARVLIGGEASGDGYFFPVTLVADISDGTRLVDEEQFGPVLPIIRYRSLEDAIARANNTAYGLNASVWGKDAELASRVAGQLEAGTIFINKPPQLAPNVPFGGVKDSGVGVEFGEEGLKAFTDIKVISR